MKTKRNQQKQKPFVRYCVLCVLGVFVCSILPLQVGAHSPSDMTVSYSLQTQELRVTITHQVSDPTTHYIREVRIEKNGVVYNKTAYTSQPDPNSFTYTYTVNATTGDVIDVTANCIQGGSKTIQYTIATKNSDTKPSSSTPGFEIILVIGALIACIALLRRK
jgi:hypothetical protein